MKKTLLAAVLATFVPLAMAEVPYYADWPPSQWPNVNTSKSVNNNTVSNSATGGAGGAASANAGSTTSANSLSIEAPRLAQAPDVISYPTAPCRISVGASGGWIGGAIGFSSSTLDENCQRIETSRQLFNLGEKSAAVQVMCLSDEARMALEATGVKCLIEKPKPQ